LQFRPRFPLERGLDYLIVGLQCPDYPKADH
jgi:hypothetical protein